MNYRDTLRCKMYVSLNSLLAILVKLHLHKVTLLGRHVDSFHEKMGTPNA